MLQMVCQACRQQQPRADFCSFCYLRVQPLPATRSGQALAEPASGSPAATEPTTGIRRALLLAGALVAREIYLENGVTLPRLGLGLLGAGSLGFILLQAFAALTAFWGWALAAAALAAWGSHRLYQLHARPPESYSGPSLDPQAWSLRMQQSLTLWLLLTGLTLSGLLALNLLTGLIPIYREAEVLGTWVGSGRNRTRYAGLTPWDGHEGQVQISLSRQEWENLKTGMRVRLRTHRGWLGIELRSGLEILPEAQAPAASTSR